MSAIFISHAVADQKLAKLLVDFLKEGIGVPNSAIFCSSVKGHGTPLTEDFNNYIREKMKNPKLVKASVRTKASFRRGKEFA